MISVTWEMFAMPGCLKRCNALQEHFQRIISERESKMFAMPGCLKRCNALQEHFQRIISERESKMTSETPVSCVCETLQSLRRSRESEAS